MTDTAAAQSGAPDLGRAKARLGQGARSWLTPIIGLSALGGGWTAAHGLHDLAGLLLTIGGLSAALSIARQRAAEHLALQLCADVSAGGFLTCLRRAAKAMRSVEHRLHQQHSITGLPTREHLVECMAADIAGDRGASLLGAIRFADFDRLAAFDQAGANEALRSFAARLSAAARDEHVLAQIDRDCFGVWFRGAADVDAATAEFRALVYVASQEFAEEDVRLTPSVEAGAVAAPWNGAAPGQILSRVTGALTATPFKGSEVALPFSPSTEAARERYALEQDLAQAIAQDQLTMVFQPVVNLAAGRMVGAEALLRWDHPTLGPVSPARFIPMVESLGLSERYGLWVLNAACREAKLWESEGLTGMKVAVNLSAHQLLDPDLKVKIERTLERHRLSPKALELELTETAAMADAGRTRQLFSELRALGISLAIDDFGAGYSSLSYLKNLPFDKLKIDREFVTGVDERRDSQAICNALIALGRGLDLLVLAEGVETAREVTTLRDLGCHVFQGYHFSKPLSGENFRALARDPAWRERLTTRPTSTESRLSA